MARFLRTSAGFKRPKRRSPIGTFTSTGGGAVAYTATLSPASYALTASSLAAQAGRPLTLSAASYTLTAASLANVLSRKATLTAASYAVSAASLGALTQRFAALSPASYTLTASSLAASVGHPTTLTAASYSLTASSVQTLVVRNVTLTRASFALTGASLEATYTPGAGAVNYTATLSSASYALSAASLTATTSVVEQPPAVTAIPGGGGGTNVFYRGRRRFEVRKAIDRALRELTEAKTPRARKRKARRVAKEFVEAFDISIAALPVPETVPPQFLPLEQARSAVFDLALKLRENEAASAENARRLAELFQQYQAEVAKIEQREEEDAIALILAVAA